MKNPKRVRAGKLASRRARARATAKKAERLRQIKKEIRAIRAELRSIAKGKVKPRAVGPEGEFQFILI